MRNVTPFYQPTAQAASEPSLGRVAELVLWLESQRWSDFAQSLARSFRQCGRLSPRQVEAAERMRAKSIARDAARTAQRGFVRAEPELGLYQVGTCVYKVQSNRSGTARYAKVLCASGEWEYVGKRPFTTLTPAARLTRDRAAAHGRLTGRCLCCGRTLTNPESIAAGIGPVCAQQFGA